MGFITSVCVHCTIARAAVLDGGDTVDDKGMRPINDSGIVRVL